MNSIHSSLTKPLTKPLTDQQIDQMNERIVTGPSAFAAAEIRIEELINLDQFPIHDIGNPLRKELVMHCRNELLSDGCSHVQDFVLPQAIQSMRDEAIRLLPLATQGSEDLNPYFSADDPNLPEDHPQRFFQTRSSSYINSDLLEPYSMLRKIYDSDVVVHFFADCLNVGPIYRWSDPLGRLPYSVMRDGDYFPWHFDGNEFTVSLLVQESEHGGNFEYCPNVRSPNDENFEEVKRVLQGDRERINILPLKTGDLQLFKGRYSMHRVTKTEGPTQRIIALPTYHTNPYVVNRAHHSEVLYGRSLPIHMERDFARTDILRD